MKLAPAGNLEAVRIFSFFDTKAHVSVQFPEETVAQVTGGNILTLLAGQRTVIDKEVHGDGRLRNLLERDRFRLFR